jgi:hypothetical protein
MSGWDNFVQNLDVLRMQSIKALPEHSYWAQFAFKRSFQRNEHFAFKLSYQQRTAGDNFPNRRLRFSVLARTAWLIPIVRFNEHRQL